MEGTHTDNSAKGQGIEKEIEIPVEGSLGLLAYGDLGLTAWREVRRKIYLQMLESQPDSEENTGKK